MLDITTLAAWGEFIGGIAVVVSLIYLASQIRQNSRLLRSSLSDDDLQRFDTLLGMFFTGMNHEHQFVTDGVMGRYVWKNRMRSMRRLFQLPGFRQWWSEWRDIYGDDFASLVDGLIREGEAAE